jgi:hypothetical protein
MNLEQLCSLINLWIWMFCLYLFGLSAVWDTSKSKINIIHTVAYYATLNFLLLSLKERKYYIPKLEEHNLLIMLHAS